MPKLLKNNQTEHSPRSVKVRIWIAVDEEGSVCAIGYDRDHSDSAKACAIEAMTDGKRGVLYSVFYRDVEVPVPQPIDLATLDAARAIFVASEDDVEQGIADRDVIAVDPPNEKRILADVSDKEIVDCLASPDRTWNIAHALNIDLAHQKDLNERMAKSDLFVKRGTWWWRADKAPKNSPPPKTVSNDQWYLELSRRAIKEQGPLRSTDLAQEGVPAAAVTRILKSTDEFYRDDNNLWHWRPGEDIRSVEKQTKVTVTKETKETVRYDDGVREWTLPALTNAIVSRLAKTENGMSLVDMACMLETTESNIVNAVENATAKLVRSGPWIDCIREFIH